ncbi:MAG: hypothetical protein AB1796_11605 [Bacillota bacterium]
MTTFNDNAKRRIAGLFDVSADLQGYYQAGTNPDLIDKILWDKLALQDEIMTVCPTNGAAGEVAYFTKVIEATYTPGGSVGEVFPFTVEVQGTERLIRGIVAETGAKTASGNGTARNLGAVATGKKLYAAMHVLAVSGVTPTLGVTIESDDADTFLTPITRITFSQATAIGAQWKEVSGPITDTWFRPVFTLGGTNPSFTIVLLLGIL